MPSIANTEHLGTQKELLITTDSTEYSVDLAKYLKKKGVVKYSAYWCPNCFDQAQLFGKKAYKELNVVVVRTKRKTKLKFLCS